MWIGVFRPRLRNSGTSASATAEKLFMSAVPRPKSLPSFSTTVNGSVSHA